MASVLATLALLMAVTSVAPVRAHARVTTAKTASKSSSDDAAPRRKAAKSTRQFTGYVTAVDKTSLTVEKRGKAPKQMVFVKHDEMRTTGEVEKEARVTVYYREEGGRSIAYRVVAKEATARSKS